MQFIPIKQEELQVGRALPWTLYDSSGNILLQLGSKPESAQQIQALLDSGACRYPEKAVQPGKRETAKAAQRELGGLSLANISLKIGDAIQLQFQSGAESTRCFVTLIGYLAEQGVIVSMPVIEGRIMQISDGLPIVARFFSGKNAYAFSAVARKSASAPFPYLHLSYPNEVRGIVVRGSSRAHANINCQAVTGDGKSYKCTARDISIGGALIALRETVGKVGDKLTLNLPVHINYLDHMLALQCLIRSVHNGHQTANEIPSNLLGLSFEEMSSQDTLVISTLLYQNLISANDFIE